MGYVTRFDLKITKEGSHGEMKPADADFFRLLQLARKYNKMEDEEISVFKEEYIAHLRKAALAMDKVSELGDLLSYLEQGISGCDEMKWYEHEQDMLKISGAFPEFIFELSGEGEENSDIWVKWFKNGQMQGGKAKVVLPAFDPKAFKFRK